MGASVFALEEILNVNKASMHNTYFALIADLGLFLSIILWILIFLYIFKMCKKVWNKNNDEEKNWNVIFLLFMIIILMQGLSESTILTYSLPNFIFMYSLAMSLKKIE